MGGGDGKGWTVCHSQGLKSEKGRTGWRKTRFIVFASLNLQPQHCKVHKKVAREGKRSITCWWNGLRDEKMRGCPTQQWWERREQGLSCVRGEQGGEDRMMAEGEIRQGGRSQRLSWSLFQGTETQDEFQHSGKAAGILQVGTCCQRNVLHLCCSRFTASWQITASFPDPLHPLLKIHFQSLS